MYNCTNVRTKFDLLIANTVLNSCPEDKEFEAKTTKNDNSTSIHDYEDLMKTGLGLETVMVEPESYFHGLSHIVSRGDIRDHTVAIESDDKLFQNLSDITNIPHDIAIDNISSKNSKATALVSPSLSNSNKCEMIIELMLQALDSDKPMKLKIHQQ